MRKQSTAPARPSEAHRHDDAHVVAAVSRPDHARVELPGQLDPHLRRLDLRKDLDEVARVEADLRGRALVWHVDLLARRPEIWIVALDAQLALVDGDLHAP